MLLNNIVFPGWGGVLACYKPKCNKTSFSTPKGQFLGTVFQEFQEFQNGRFMFQSVPVFQMFQEFQEFQVFQVLQRGEYGKNITK